VRALIDALEIRGPFAGISGHDRHVRALVRELDQLGVRINLAAVPGWSLKSLPDLDPFFLALTDPVDADVVLHFCMPHQALVVPDRFNVNYTMFEATRVHRSWVAQSHAHDLVVVPTQSSREAWLASGAPADRIAISPLGVDPAIGSPSEPMLLCGPGGRPVSAYHTRFLNVSQLISRKNLDGLLRVWMGATERADDTILVLKVDTDAARRGEPAALLEAACAQLGRAADDAAPVLFLDDVLADAEMPRLYACATHYISMSLGEGWDMPMLEAAAAGLELLAPWHSAYMAYLDAQHAHLFDCSLEPARRPSEREAILFQGASWWRPDERQAADVVRAVVAGRAPRKPPPQQFVLDRLNWRTSAESLLTLVSERLQAREQRKRSRPRGYALAARARAPWRLASPRGRDLPAPQGSYPQTPQDDPR
jgi:glycosyltransferase involved in cell wall biosynthesis